MQTAFVLGSADITGSPNTAGMMYAWLISL